MIKCQQKLHIFGRYTYFGSELSGDPYFGAAGGQGFGNGGFAGTDSARDQSLAAGGDYVVSTRWLTDFRFGYYRIHLNEQGPNFNQPLGNELGIPNANVGDLSLNGGLPQFNIDNASNGTNGGGNLEYGTSANQFLQNASQFQFVNNWSHMVGNHNIKFGGDVRYGLNHIIGLDNNNVRSGNYHFAAIRTGSDTSPGLGFATFLLGDTTSFQRTQTQNTNAQERQKRIFSYVQDQWRLTSKLTLNYGLRWEIYFPETVNGKGQGGLLDLNTGDIRIAGYGPYGTNLNVAEELHEPGAASRLCLSVHAKHRRTRWLRPRLWARMVRQHLRRGSHIFLPHPGLPEFEPGDECRRGVQFDATRVAYRRASRLHVCSHSGQTATIPCQTESRCQRARFLSAFPRSTPGT